MAHSIINDSGGGDEGPMSAINVTPLVDVMLCLLIIFMVATPMMAPDGGKEVDIPAGHGKKMTEEDFLYSVITIDKAGSVFLGPLAFSTDVAGMQQELANNAKLAEHDMVFLQADKNVPFDRIVDVLVGLKQAKISSVGFVTKPDDKALKEAAP